MDIISTDLAGEQHFLPGFELAKPEAADIDLHSYNTYLIMASTGKDSVACLLHLLESGVDKSKIELWHHDVDGQENSDLMDWPITRDYCRKFAAAFELPLYFSWKQGGFEREMLRENALTAPTVFETPDGIETVGGDRGKPNTRRKFPQTGASLSSRWCSSYLKIDPAATAIRNQARFNNSRTLVITGERAEESVNRAKYLEFEPHRADGRSGRSGRLVDQWRPVLRWDEQAVWNIMQRWGVEPHPAYKLGWGRVSCMACIFGSRDQWASIKQIAPEKFERIAQYEEEFGVTIQRKHSVRELAASGTPYAMDAAIVRLAMSTVYDAPILTDNWQLPAGAFGESNGPT